MKGKIGLLGQQPVGLDGPRNIGGLDRDLNIVKIQILQQRGVAQGAFHHAGGSDARMPLENILLQRAGVDTDADGDAMVLAHNPPGRLNIFAAADVTRIEPQSIGAMLWAAAMARR